ncbi:MAG TPA: polysaccharide deacetylase family protein [Solirubrobacteraceae bacterium]|jgi:peptidoglycan/xylan/chitin deacetylase (PgdA/CDA1 family)
MSPRWNWDFEDEPRARRTVPRLPLKPLRPSGDARYRRRRLGAALVVVALAIVLVVALAASHGSGAPSPAGANGHRAKAAAPSEPVLDTRQRDEKAVSSVLAYTPFIRSAAGRKREIALTFDDGPGPYTPQVLDVLEREHVPATFFVIGVELRYFSASTAREIRDGFVIGDHTETHPMLAHLSAHDQHEELFEQAARIELLGGPRPTLFRPPYGSFNQTTFALLHQMHMLMVLWSVDTDDYEQPGVEVIVHRALEGAAPGAIILMHDAGGDRAQTIAALPTIIDTLRKRGYRLVTVPQLLHDDPPPAGQPLPTNLSGG